MNIDILKSQKLEFENKLKEPYIERRFVRNFEDNDLVKVILGPRRSGKSFFGLHLLKSLGSCAYVNFDDERLTGLKDYDELVVALDALYDKPRYLLFDEIQNVAGWEFLVNRLQRQGRRLIVTGSNAHLLSSELATHLTGRHVPIVLFPFSFMEYADALNPGVDPTVPGQTQLLRRYLSTGGFPEPLLKKMDRDAYLSTLLESLLFKDIIKRFRIRSGDGMEDLAFYLLSNAGSEYSSTRLAEVTKCKSPTTVEKYIGHLEEAFLFFPLRRFSFKVREQARANRKIFCIDNGFVTAKGFQLSANTGRLAENAVAIVLHKQELEGRHKVYFWKNPQQQEVDFVLFRDNSVGQLIQVCWKADDPKTRDREIRILVKAGEELRCNNLLVLNESKEAEEQVDWFGFKGTVRYQPLWKWMTENN